MSAEADQPILGLAPAESLEMQGAVMRIASMLEEAGMEPTIIVMARKGDQLRTFCFGQQEDVEAVMEATRECNEGDDGGVIERVM